MHTDTAENPDELRKDKEEGETEEERVFGSRALLVPWLTGHVCLHSSSKMLLTGVWGDNAAVSQHMEQGAPPTLTAFHLQHGFKAFTQDSLTTKQLSAS